MAEKNKWQQGFDLAKQVGGAGAGKQYILKNVDAIAQAGGQYQQPQKKTDPRLGGNMLGGYGSPGVTGAKGTGGGYIGMGNPQQIAALHANPQLTQQTYGFTPQSKVGSFGGGQPAGYKDYKLGIKLSGGEVADKKIREWQQQLASNPHMDAGQRQRINQNIQQYAANYQQSTGQAYPGLGGGGGSRAPGGQGGGMPGGQGLAGGGLSGTINQALQQLLGGGGGGAAGPTGWIRPGQSRQFTGGGSTGGAPIGTRGAFGAQQAQGQQQQGQFPTNALEAQQAGQIAQQLRSEEQAIREDFGRRGQAGSPAMEAALRQARDRASQGRSQGLQQLQVSAYGQNREQREADRNALMRALQLALSATGQSQGMQQQQMQNMLNMFGG